MDLNIVYLYAWTGLTLEKSILEIPRGRERQKQPCLLVPTTNT